MQTIGANEKRPVPHDIEAEQATLGAVFIKPTAIDQLKVTLEIDDFFLPAHREIFESMLNLDRTRVPIDSIAVADDLRVRGMLARLDGAESYLFQLHNGVPTAENVGHYSRLVREKAVLRRLIAACAEIHARAHGDYGDFETFMSEAEQQILKLGQRSSVEPIRIGDVLTDAMDVIEQKSEDASRFYVRTGLRAVDRRIGGFGRGELIIIAGGPGSGKTALASGTAVLSARDQKIPNLIFSMEMTMQEQIERDIGFLGNIETRNIHRGALSRDDWTQALVAEKALRPLPIWVYEDNANVDVICAIARRWAGKVRAGMPLADDGLPPLLLITVDYLQLVERVVRRGSSESDAIAYVSRSLKMLAKQLKVPVVAISALNREHTKEKDKDGGQRKPKISDLRGSGAIEFDANKIIFPCPKPALPAKPGEPPILDSEADIVIGKNRSGAVGEITVRWSRKTMGFYDLDPHEDFDGDRRYAD